MSLSSSDESDVPPRVATIHMSPSALALLPHPPSSLHLGELSSSSRSTPTAALTGGGGAAEFPSPATTPFEESRPSPQLLYAMHPPANANTASSHPHPSSSTTSRTSRSPHFKVNPPIATNLAGRVPPNLALELPALSTNRKVDGSTLRLPDDPNGMSDDSAPSVGGGPSLLGMLSPPPRGRTRSASNAGLTQQTKFIQQTQPASSAASAISFTGTRSTRSMSDSMLLPDEDDSEDHQLLPSGVRKLGVALRNRSHSAAGSSPSMLPQGLLQEPIAWNGKTSRILVMCASGILFVLIFVFCSVVGLRMAAHVKYDNTLCLNLESNDPSSLAQNYNSNDYQFDYVSRWIPNYRQETWDQDWYQNAARTYFMEQRKLDTTATSSASSSSSDSDSTDPLLADRISTLWSDASWLSELRLNHFRMMGTHNSYHLASDLPLSMHQYSHATLPAQLLTYRKGIRQLELDIHLIPGKKVTTTTPNAGVDMDPSSSTLSGLNSSLSDGPVQSSTSVSGGAGLVVYHLQWLDDKTTCYCLRECLDLISIWSHLHPAHFPIFLTFEIKSRLWEDVETGLRGVTCEDIETVEKEILDVFPRTRLITPLEIRGGHERNNWKSQYSNVRSALKEASKQEASFRKLVKEYRKKNNNNKNSVPTLEEYPKYDYGWPKLIDSLGKIVVIWLDDMHNLSDRLNCISTEDTTTTTTTPSQPKTTTTPTSPVRRTNWHHDPNRIVFIAQNDMDKDYASFITQNRPRLAMETGTILHALGHGFMVRTMTDESSDALPDPQRFRHALRSGAHMISTDFEECEIRTEFQFDSGQDIETSFGTLEQSLDEEPSSHTSIHASAESIEQSDSSTLIGTNNDEKKSHTFMNSSTIYCEHLEDEWPFECNPITSPFFCKAALEAARLQMRFMDDEDQLAKQ